MHFAVLSKTKNMDAQIKVATKTGSEMFPGGVNLYLLEFGCTIDQKSMSKEV